MFKELVFQGFWPYSRLDNFSNYLRQTPFKWTRQIFFIKRGQGYQPDMLWLFTYIRTIFNSFVLSLLVNTFRLWKHMSLLSSRVHCIVFRIFLAQSAGLKNRPTASLQRDNNNPYEYPGYDIKQSDGETPIMQELWGLQKTPSLPSLPGPLWPIEIAPDRFLFINQIEQFVI